MSEVKPIKPTEILNKKIATIPSVIIQIVNELLVKNWDGHSSVIRMDELFDKYFKRTGLPDDRANRDTVHDNNWLHFESAYRNEGWNVVFKQPIPSQGDMDFEPYYEFTLPNIPR